LLHVVVRVVITPSRQQRNEWHHRVLQADTGDAMAVDPIRVYS
jgi:hypothetical protein